MDSLLMVGCQDAKLTAFLEKLGYSLVIADGEVPLPELLQDNVIDLILVDTRIDLSVQDLCEYLRSEKSFKKIPIICLSEDRGLESLASKSLLYACLKTVN